VPAALVVAGVGGLFLPVLGLGPVAEDYQFAVDGARTAERPSRLLEPFQLVWRPAARLPFVLWAWAGGEDWRPLRAAQWLGGMILAVLAWALLRQPGKLPSPLAAALSVWWLASPLGNSLVCGETAFLGHQVLVACVLGVLLLWRPAMTASRWLAQGALLLAAAASSEAWVVLPAVLLAQDLVIHRLPWRAAARRAAPWFALLAAYLLAYGRITGFGYRGLYAADATTVVAKLLVTTGMLLHLHPLVGLDFPAALAASPGPAAVAVVLLLLLLAGLLRRRLHATLWLALGLAVFLLPTLPSPEQSGRWLVLPWLGLLAAVGGLLRSLWATGRPWRWLAAGLAPVLVALALADAASTRDDVRDWTALAALTRRLEAEAQVLLSSARAGDVLVVLRRADGGPLQEIRRRPHAPDRVFFPRPDDPYGIVSLSALLSWLGRPLDLAFPRVERVPPGIGARIWFHTASGFEPAHGLPPLLVRHPSHPGEGVPGVILEARSWQGFEPGSFP
jgi:hypothetical protein